jgi:hypothetical protein
MGLMKLREEQIAKLREENKRMKETRRLREDKNWFTKE